MDPSDGHRHDAGIADDRADAADRDGEDHATGATDGDDAPPGCPRCGHDEARTARTSTGGEAPIVGIGSVEQFATVTCERCGYTDFYDVDGGGSPVDLFLGYGHRPADERPRATMKSSGDVFHCGACGTAFTDGDAETCPNCDREFV